MAALKPCLDCGEPTEEPRCPEHTTTNRPGRRSPRDAGYDRQWDLLSARARRLQDFCSDCGTRDDLTADHSAEAWRRKDAGLPIRLQDIEVVCRGCNTRRGRARPRGETPTGAVRDLAARRVSK